ncbi:cytochrome c553 [Microvirga flocculans]|uniref:Cytochrome c553 n=1 Tax=Microvirga flocculans TaxID=217168 RepID=A0A7W6IDW6_9HYPH|nr:cytochrome c [Microvirga flocculans]MBB4039029.1 cytochrome c553 [Microvirga flocculans]
MKLAIALAATLIAFAPAGVEAGDARAGRQKITACQACHGLDGLSKNPEAPNLAGQVEDYLVRSLTAYRSGERKNESMNIVAKDLSDADIADVAAYYAAIQVDVLPP